MRARTLVIGFASAAMALSPFMVTAANAAPHATATQTHLTGKVIDLPAAAVKPSHHRGPCGYPVSRPVIFAGPTNALLHRGQRGHAVARVMCNGHGIGGVHLTMRVRFGYGWCSTTGSQGYSSCVTSPLYRSTSAFVTGRGTISNPFGWLVLPH